MARKPAKRKVSRPLLPPPRRGGRKPAARRKGPSNVGALTKRLLVVWPAKVTAVTTGAAVRHGGATAKRVGSTAYAGLARRREEKRAHGHRPVVRDLSVPGGRPMSLAQVQTHLLGLDQARENRLAEAEGREPRQIVYAERLPPLPTEYVERIAAPQVLTRGERRQLSRQGWLPESWGWTHKRISEQLGDAGPVDAPTPIRPPAHGGGRPLVEPDQPTRGGTPVIEPKSFDDLANPDIDQQNWQEELPEHTRQAQQLFERAVESVGAYLEYHQQGQSREDVVQAIQAAHEAMGQARESMGQAASAAEQWASGVRVPRYDKAG